MEITNVPGPVSFFFFLFFFSSSFFFLTNSFLIVEGPTLQIGLCVSLP